MHWTPFASDLASGLLSGLVGTMFGVIFGIRAEARRTRQSDALRDRRALQALMDRLATKRAFGHSDDVGMISGNDADRERCVLSVLDARERITGTAENVHFLEDVHGQLRDMERACSAYISYVERFPERYAMGLTALGRELWRSMTALRDLVVELRIERPGRGTLEVPSWLDQSV